ncbi:MAG: hypothetical protein WBN22_15275 [Verrucomicrobiia bacterium]
MKPDDFESQLQRQPLRRIPAGWRAEILREGRRVAVPETGNINAVSPSKLNWRAMLTNIFWPNPQAWAGLAAIWILILAVDFSMRDKSPVVADKSAPPSPQVIAELRQQQRLLVELLGSSQTREAEPPKFLPRPRTARAEILTA